MRLPIIKLNDVYKSYSYGDKRIEVLKGVRLRVAPGEMVGIFGPSGSGKSTLLHIISTLDFADSGYVEVLERDINPRHFSEDDLALFRRRYIGLIFQSHNLFPEMTAYENVYFALRMRGFGHRESKVRALNTLNSLGIDRQAHKNVQFLSGGERQRVAVARALAMGAEIYVCDEPTGELDRENAINLMEILVSLAREGKTFVIATHDDRLLPYFDTVYKLEDGLLHRVEKKEVHHGKATGAFGQDGDGVSRLHSRGHSR
ncbi:MAG: ABC transporter ATP-binding protein [Thermotogae bacterium]|nr:ABC transporter ATP-binding protein [Thermotogota bacterium]